jgi:hypothetical protein
MLYIPGIAVIGVENREGTKAGPPHLDPHLDPLLDPLLDLSEYKINSK